MRREDQLGLELEHEHGARNRRGDRGQGDDQPANAASIAGVTLSTV